MIEYTKEELGSIWEKMKVTNLLSIYYDDAGKELPYDKLVFSPRYSPYADILFKEPLEKVPLYINSENPTYRAIAKWRLNAGK